MGGMENFAPKIRVLIADDSLQVRTGIRRLVTRQADMQVVGEADNGQSALKMALELEPDVLVLDIQMPVLDGVEVARRLVDQMAAVHILVLSAYVDAQFIQAFMDLHVEGYLSKDEAPQKLAGSIRCVAEGSRACYSLEVLEAGAGRILPD